MEAFLRLGAPVVQGLASAAPFAASAAKILTTKTTAPVTAPVTASSPASSPGSLHDDAKSACETALNSMTVGANEKIYVFIFHKSDKMTILAAKAKSAKGIIDTKDAAETALGKKSLFGFGGTRKKHIKDFAVKK